MLVEIGLPRKFAKLSKILWKFGSFGKEFRWTKFNAVEGVNQSGTHRFFWFFFFLFLFFRKLVCPEKFDSVH